MQDAEVKSRSALTLNREASIGIITEHLKQARRVLFITGAGISADSGLPTYRGVGGLYNDGGTEDGLPIEQALSGAIFSARPDITWKYLLQIEQNCRGAQPNAAHRLIAALERNIPYVMVLTQNVDGLHGKAGSRNIIEIHGGLHELHCTACNFREVVEDYSLLELPPRCPKCKGVLRPDIVLFGEALPPGAIDRLTTAFQAGFDMVFTIGTSAVFPYISQPVVWAAERGMTTVEINPVKTQLSDIVDFYVPMRAAEAMTLVAAGLTNA